MSKLFISKWFYPVVALFFTLLPIGLLIDYNGLYVFGDFWVLAGLIPYFFVLWAVALIFYGEER